MTSKNAALSKLLLAEVPGLTRQIVRLKPTSKDHQIGELIVGCGVFETNGPTAIYSDELSSYDFGLIAVLAENVKASSEEQYVAAIVTHATINKDAIIYPEDYSEETVHKALATRSLIWAVNRDDYRI